MTTTASIVPHLTRADLLAIAAWTEANKRARAEYERDPFAATTEGSSHCARCRENKHHRCTGQALRRSRGRAYDLVSCTCHLNDHREGATQ